MARLLLCLLIGATASVILGQDANWDLRNYHIYNPFALLEGRLSTDLMPAGLHTNFNPLLDLPYYVLATGPLATSPRIMAAAAGIPFGLLLFATLSLARWVLLGVDDSTRLLPWIAVAIGGTAAATFSEIGTTFNDVQVSALVLGALALAGPGCIERPVLWRLACAGAMVGAAVALKPTSVVLVPGVVVALLMVAPARHTFHALAIFGLGMTLAGLALGGPWAIFLYEHYSNPTFPLMNGLFRSSWYPPVDFQDRRFLPRTTLQSWFYPLWWSRQNIGLVSEFPFRDARMALAMLALPVLAFSFAQIEPHRRRPVLALVLAALIGYLIWLRAFSILRYAVALEAFAGIIIVLTIQALASRWRRTTTPLAAIVLAALLLQTRVLDFGRIPFGSRVFDVESVTLPPDSLVLAVGGAVSMVIPFVDAPNFRAIGVTDTTKEARGYALFNETISAIHAHKGPIFAIVQGPTPFSRTTTLASIPMETGLDIDAAKCRAIQSNLSFDAGIDLCPAQHREPTSLPPISTTP